MKKTIIALAIIIVAVAAYFLLKSPTTKIVIETSKTETSATTTPEGVVDKTKTVVGRSTEVECYDGQGSTIYISKERLLKNIESTSATEIGRYFIPPTISSGYVAKSSTNSCGVVVSIVIVDNGTKKEVSQNNFDKFIKDYNASCSNCLMQLDQSGNSPLFVKDHSSGKSYLLENNNGTLILRSIDESTSTNGGGTAI